MPPSDTVITFADAKLIPVPPNGAYIEMARMDPESSPCCPFCSKTTTHEHDFSGKFKLDMTDGKCFVSFAHLASSKKHSAMEVIPIQAKKPKQGLGIQPTPVYPLVTDTDKNQSLLVHSWLSGLLSNTETQDVMAVKNMKTESILVLKLDHSYKKETNSFPGNCNCFPLDNNSTESVLHHFEHKHGIKVIKKILGQKGSSDDSSYAGSTKIQCEACFQVFKTRKSYRQHIRSTHSLERREKTFQCHLCEKMFFKSQHLKDHLNIHIGVKPHQCDHCENRYSSSSSLKAHLLNAHDIGQAPRCQLCDKGFHSQAQLNRHDLKVHQRDPSRRCPYCQAMFLRKSNLDKHMENCRNLDLKCQTCDSRFKNEDTLKRHLTSSHGIMPWNSDGDTRDLLKCKICEHDFAPTEMENHLRFSHGVLSVRPGAPFDFSVSEAAEALLRTLTPQPDYLLRCLTPLPMETLDDFMTH